MRSKSLELMEKIKTYVEQYYSEHYVTPSINEIAVGIGSSKATVYRYLVDMNQSGMLDYDGSSRTIETKAIQKFSPASISAPVVGVIPCGEPELEEEQIEEYVSLPVSIFGNEKSYILRASGDSMVDAGIAEGDLVVIRLQTEAEVGDVVVALDENNASTLKQYAGIDESSGEALLRYCNREKYPNRVIRVKQLVVQGVAKQVVKALDSVGMC